MSNALDFQGLNILIIGDVMIDRYMEGRIERMSPEAPVPILDQEVTQDRLGGAANVALNIKALGANATLMGVIGSDESGTCLQKLIDNQDHINSHLAVEEGRKTTVKTRIIAAGKQLMRVDIEDKKAINRKSELILLDEVIKQCSNGKVNAIVLQDYNKGVLTPTLINSILLYAQDHNIPTVIDPKENHFFEFKSCTIFKPNKREIETALDIEISSIADLDRADQELRNRLDHNISMITLSEDGVYYNDGQSSKIIKPKPRAIADVCGAGDGVLSIVTLAYLRNMSLDKIAELSNIVGGQICEKTGVAPADFNTLLAEWNDPS